MLRTSFRWRARWALATAALALLAVAAAATPATAFTSGGGMDCTATGNLGGTLSVTATKVERGESVTLTWKVDTSSDTQSCNGLYTQTFDGAAVATSGSLVSRPMETHTYRLTGYYGVLSRELAAVTVTVPEPEAQLPGSWRGTITSDGGVSSGISADVTGTPHNLTASITLDPGVHVSCDGIEKDLDDKTPIDDMSGSRAKVNVDGSSTYDFTGSFTSSGSDVDVTITGSKLSVDGETWTGAADLVIKPPLLAVCRTSWPFTLERPSPRSKPSSLVLSTAVYAVDREATTAGIRP